MKKINVIDLDKTMIPYDSFRKYIFIFLQDKQFSLKIIYLVLLRKIRLLNMAEFKKKIISIVREDSKYIKRMDEFSKQIVSDFDDSILKEIHSFTDSETINILCSASPEDYINRIAKIMSWNFLCSTLNGDKFLHMYGKQKFESVLEQYDRSTYDYNLAISDSNSDLELLYMFKEFRLIETN